MALIGTTPDGQNNIYDGFSDLPPVDDIKTNDQVHYSSRMWKWDGQKWILFSENVIGDSEFRAVDPVEVEIDDSADNKTVIKHYFDIQSLDELTTRP